MFSHYFILFKLNYIKLNFKIFAIKDKLKLLLNFIHNFNYMMNYFCCKTKKNIYLKF